MRNDKEFTRLWHDNATGMWARWIDPTYHKNALEVGSFEGASAIWLLDMIPDLKITCVDIFCSAFDDVTGEYEQRFDRNVAEYGERVTKLKGASADILKTLTGQSYDLIYIDGHHTYEAVKQDAALAYPLLAPGGLMIFDDYDNNDFGVRQAVNEFIKPLKDIRILRQDGDYQMAIKKRPS